MTRGAEYDATYYASHLGPEPYRRGVPAWEAFFDHVAGQIVSALAPKTVLDAGCGIGFLIEKLRARGVEAWGIDISEYAIAQIPADIAPYCRVASVAEPLERDYDLIVCLEVLEHVSDEEGRQTIANFAAHTDSVVFSSTPNDFDEPTHVNVRPTEYWLAIFAEHGFSLSGVDVSSIAPHAVHLEASMGGWRREHGRPVGYLAALLRKLRASLPSSGDARRRDERDDDE